MITSEEIRIKIQVGKFEVHQNNDIFANKIFSSI